MEIPFFDDFTETDKSIVFALAVGVAIWLMLTKPKTWDKLREIANSNDGERKTPA